MAVLLLFLCFLAVVGVDAAMQLQFSCFGATSGSLWKLSLSEDDFVAHVRCLALCGLFNESNFRRSYGLLHLPRSSLHAVVSRFTTRGHCSKK